MSVIRILFACVVLSLPACSGGGSSTPIATSQSARSTEAETTIDGTVVHLTAIQTSQLPDAVARQYGIDRAPTDILLLVNLREVGNGQAPVITATVTDLLGHTNPVQLREVQVAQPGGSTIDYIGTVDVALPETLRFTVDATRGGASATVELSRDFYPQ